MFGFPKNRPPGVVVEHDQLGTPPERYGEARVKADADRHLEGFRPRLRRPEQRIGPGLRPHERTDLAAARKEVGEGHHATLYLLPASSAGGDRCDIEATVRFAE